MYARELCCLGRQLMNVVYIYISVVVGAFFTSRNDIVQCKLSDNLMTCPLLVARCSLPVCYKCVLYIVLIFLRDFQLGLIREECNLWLQFKRRVVYAMMHMHRKYVWDRIVLNRKSNASRGECRYQCINGRLTVHIHTHLSSFSFCPSPPYALEFFIDLSIISFWPDVQRTLTCDHGEWERNEHHHNCVVY